MRLSVFSLPGDVDSLPASVLLLLSICLFRYQACWFYVEAPQRLRTVHSQGRYGGANHD